MKLTCLLPVFLLLSAAVFAQDKEPVADTTVTAIDTVPAIVSDTAYVTPEEDTSEKESAKPDLYMARQLPDTMIQRWKDDPVMAYANDPDYWQRKIGKRQQPDGFSLALGRLLVSKGFQFFIYIVLGALLVFVIVRIMMDNNVSLFYRSSRKRKGAIGIGDESGEMEENLAEKLQHYINGQDYRQATRYLYLITLTLLNEKGLIRWHPEATNQDYQRQLNGSAWDRSFRDLTGFYEKVWYGEFPLGAAQFDRLHHYFEDFFKTVPA